MVRIPAAGSRCTSYADAPARDGRGSPGFANLKLVYMGSWVRFGGESQKQIAEQVIREGLSVRETESLVSERSHYHSVRSNGNLATKPASTPDVHISDLQNRLQERFGTKVAVKYRKGKGAVEIRFFNDDDLDRIMEIVGIKMD